MRYCKLFKAKHLKMRYCKFFLTKHIIVLAQLRKDFPMKKIYTALFTDLHWKLFALVAAAVIWFIGMNMSDPYRNDIVSVRLRLDNLEIMAREGIVVTNAEALREIDVAVQVRGRRSYMENLHLMMPEVSIDFRAVDSDAIAEGAVAQRLRVSSNLQAGFEHISISPAYADVSLDRFSQRNHFVQTVQEGEVFPGFELQAITLSNERVMVSGALSDVSDVSLVLANVDITGIHGEEELPVRLVVLDAYGSDMTERIRLNVEETTALVRVWQVRSADVVVRGAGELANGFAFAGYVGGGVSVEIVGSEEILNDVEEIRAEIDLSDARGNVTSTILLEEWLPEGVSLRRGEITEVEVTARVEPIETRHFTVPRGNVRSRGVVGLYQLVDSDAPIRITIGGPRSIIATLTAAQIEPEFDLRGREIGIHEVPLVIGLPAGLTMVGQSPTLLVQIHEPVAAEPIELPSENEEDEDDEDSNYYELPYEEEEPESSDEYEEYED